MKLINNHDEEIDEVSLSFETNPNLGILFDSFSLSLSLSFFRFSFSIFDNFVTLLMFQRILVIQGEAVFFLKEEEKLPGNQLLVKELLPPHSNRTCSFFFYHTKSEQIEIKVKVISYSYTTHICVQILSKVLHFQARYHCKSGFSSSVETKVSLQCIFPFATTWELFTPQFSSIKSEELRQNDIVLLCLDLGLNCQTTLELVDVDLVLVCLFFVILQF